MTPEEIELESAARVVDFADQRARYHCEPRDREATRLAILLAALELATPGYSAAQRAALFAEDA